MGLFAYTASILHETAVGANVALKRQPDMTSGPECGILRRMPYLVRIQIPDLGVVSALASGTEPPAPGTRHVVESGGSQDIGTVLETSTATRSAADAVPARIVRAATEADDHAEATAAVHAAGALKTLGQLLAHHSIQARPVKARFGIDRKRLVVWYLPQILPPPDVKSIEGEFRRKARASSVEFRMATPREAAAMLGGTGCCGRPLCCATWMRCPREAGPQRNAPVPISIAGLCGQSRCCHDFAE